jgi:selenocysteine-specific elongation factor
VRSYSPQITIAGGKILDVPISKHRRRDFVQVQKYLNELIAAVMRSDHPRFVSAILESYSDRGATFRDLQSRTGFREEVLRSAIDECIAKKTLALAEDIFVSQKSIENLKSKTLAEIEIHHKREPLTRGILRETLREKIFSNIPAQIFRFAIASLVAEKKISAEGDVVRFASHSRELSADEKLLRDRLAKIYRDSKFEVPTLDAALEESIRGTKLRKEQARKIFQLFLDSNQIAKVTDDFFFLRETLDGLRSKVASLGVGTEIDVSKFKELAGVSRKYAIPLLEYFDREKVTRRVGDKRLIL